MCTLLQDLGYSVRLLWNKRAYSITVILMLALGIGAFTSVFSVANAVLLKPVRSSQNGPVGVPVGTSHQNFLAKSDQCFDGELSRLEKRVLFLLFRRDRLAAVELRSLWRRHQQSRACARGGDFTGSILSDRGGAGCGTLAESRRQFPARIAGWCSATNSGSAPTVRTHRSRARESL